MFIPLSLDFHPFNITFKINEARDFPGGPVVKTPRCQCRGRMFDPWLGILHAAQCGQKLKKIKNK